MTATAIAAAESPEAAGPRTAVRSTLVVSAPAPPAPADRPRLSGPLRLAPRRALLPGGVAPPGARLRRLPAADRRGRARRWWLVFGTSLDALRADDDGDRADQRAWWRCARASSAAVCARRRARRWPGRRRRSRWCGQPLPSDVARPGGADGDALPGAASRVVSADAAAVAGGGRRGRHRPGGQVHDRDAAAGAAGWARADAQRRLLRTRALDGGRDRARPVAAERLAGRSTTAGPAPASRPASTRRPPPTRRRRATWPARPCSSPRARRWP